MDKKKGKQVSAYSIDDIFGDKHIVLSNALIQAREKTSLLESKIEFLAIYRFGDAVRTREKVDSDGNRYNAHYVVLNAQEVRQLAGKSGNSLYNDMFNASLELGRKQYIYRDAGEKKYKVRPLYTAVDYEDGKLEIEFNPETEHLFLEMAGNFTQINLGIAFKFKTLGGFGMYKLFKSFMYTLPQPDLSLSQEEFPFIIKEYSLGELRLQLGYVDLNQADIKAEATKISPDFDKIEALEKTPAYKRFNDFNKRILEPGRREIEEISDIFIADIEKLVGSHNKTEGVRFKLQYNRAYFEREKHGSQQGGATPKVKTKNINLSEDEIDDIIDEIRSFMDAKLTTKELKSIAKAADYNVDIIKQKWALMKSQSNIENVVGWMISAIEKNYSSDSDTGRTSRSNQSSSFSNFEERDYDYQELLDDIKK